MLRYSDNQSAPKMRRVHLVDRLGSNPNIPGTVHITTSHLVFRSDDGAKEIWVPNALVQLIDRLTLTPNETKIIIKCKNFLILTFLVSKDRESADIFDSLVQCTKLYNIGDAFAFLHKDAEKKSSVGWSRLNWEAEFSRQQISSSWKLSEFNDLYQYCDTYPEQLWFPSNASKQHLIGSSKFRSKSRLPVLTYFHKQSGAVICRCAQPLTGFSARCVEDESLMEHIRSANPTTAPVFLVDTRPRINAMANKMQGKGFEDIKNYNNMQFHSFDIENIHVMRSSQAKLLEACQKDTNVTEYLKAIDSSGWLKHLKTLFDCGKFIADSVVAGNSCVVHCSDGWDRTSQTVSIAQILLDPYFCTIEGFQTLIDKDWLGFGFKFDDRCGHISSVNDENLKEISPVFTQFIDVIYQIMRKRPTAFEFNERFLFEINEHAYSCLYGTFLGNCEKDRRDLRAASRTQSLWRVMDAKINVYKNPLYEAGSLMLNTLDLQYSSFVVWTAMYNRFDTGIQPREYINDIPFYIKEHISVMEKAMDTPAICEKIALNWQILLDCEECSSAKYRAWVAITVRMITYGRILVRAPQTLAKELSFRVPGIKTYCAIAAGPATASEPSASINNVQKVDVSCCGFPKDLVGTPSTVLEQGVFGEDACFISRYKNVYAAGVADGVGGWRKYGVDPSVFSSNLMKNCSKVVRSGDFQPERPDLIIGKAFEKLSVSPRPTGSSTACVVVIHQRTLYAANLGDSGYLVYRGGQIVKRSTEQVHYFNAPFQLTLLPEKYDRVDLDFIRDTPENSELEKFAMESGDIVLIATDGLWDNVSDSVIEEVLKDADASNLQAKCNSIALIARCLSQDGEHLSPFAQKAGQHGIRTTGGKPDDITLVLLYVS